jgi:hypothetical protein
MTVYNAVNGKGRKLLEDTAPEMGISVVPVPELFARVGTVWIKTVIT